MDEVVPDRILDVDGQPACLSFDPTLSSRLAVGTYNLVEHQDGQQKIGAILIFHVPSADPSSPELKERIELSAAVFDLVWTGSPHCLIVALSDGSLAFFGFSQTQTLELRHQQSLFESSVGITSLAYHARSNDAPRPLLACTTSTGEVGFFTFDEASSADDATQKFSVRRLAFDVERHDQEAWCIHFSERTPVAFSGGDDSVFKAYDISEVLSIDIDKNDVSFEERSAAERTLFKDRKTHGAGVTAIASLPWVPASSDNLGQFLLTGSYDETIRLFHYPSRKLLTEKRLDGGVWRIKILPQSSSTLLQIPAGKHARTTSFESILEDRLFLVAASCMQAGTRILRLSRKSSTEDALGSWSFEIIAKVNGMDLNYGFDYYRGTGTPWADGSLKMYSISFYDKVLVMWKLKERRSAETTAIGIRVHKGSDTSLASRGLSDYEIRPEDSVSNDGRRGDEPRSFPPSPLLLAKDLRFRNVTPSEHTDDEEVPMQIEPNNMGLL